MNRALIVVAILTLGLVMGGCSGSPAPDISGISSITACDEYTGQALQAGDLAPVFQFQSASGQAVSSSDFRGKVVLLNFWATWCGYCKMEMPYIQQIYDEWSAEELVVLAMDIGESSSDVAKFVQDKGLSFPVLLDSEGKVAIQYFKGTSVSIPRTFFIDKDGVIQAIKFGAFSSVEEIESILSQLE